MKIRISDGRLYAYTCTLLLLVPALELEGIFRPLLLLEAVFQRKGE